MSDTPLTDAHEEETWGVLTSWKDCNRGWREFAKSLERRLTAASLENERLKQLLEKYGWHDHPCAWTEDNSVACSCGWLDVVAALQQGGQGEG